ncbi:hypothetical protein GCM10027174_22780 [Salinifilum aidingensis]
MDRTVNSGTSSGGHGSTTMWESTTRTVTAGTTHVRTARPLPLAVRRVVRVTLPEQLARTAGRASTAGQRGRAQPKTNAGFATAAVDGSPTVEYRFPSRPV